MRLVLRLPFLDTWPLSTYVDRVLFGLFADRDQ